MVKKIVLLGVMVGVGTAVITVRAYVETDYYKGQRAAHFNNEKTCWSHVQRGMNLVNQFSNDKKLKKNLQDTLNVFRKSLMSNDVNDNFINLQIFDLSLDQTVLGTSGKKSLDNGLVSAIKVAIENIGQTVNGKTVIFNDVATTFETVCKSLDSYLGKWYKQRKTAVGALRWMRENNK